MNNKNELIALDACIFCGLPKDKHHEFEAQTKPKGCKCEWESWKKEPGPICDNYQNSGRYALPSSDVLDETCANCEHDKECHE